MISFSRDDIFLVTGASSGLGKGIALRLNELGGTVLALGRDKSRLEDARLQSSEAERFVPIVKDLSEDQDNLNKFVKSIAQTHGKLKGLVHSAGIVDLTPLKGINMEKAHRIFSVNYFAALGLAKGFARKNVNSDENSSIVFISSLGSIRGYAGQIIYASSKGAVNSMVYSMAVELARQGIRVNSVQPGHIVTMGTESYNQHYSDEYKYELQNMYPLGLGTPEDVADLVAFLLSDRARWITGQNLIIDGGRHLI